MRLLLFSPACHHQYEKRDGLAVAQTALDAQDQKQELQSPEEALSILSDLAAGSNFDEGEEDVEYYEDEYDEYEEDEFLGANDEFGAIDGADDLEALNNDDKEKDCVVYETITVVPECTATKTACAVAEATTF